MFLEEKTDVTRQNLSNLRLACRILEQKIMNEKREDFLSEMRLQQAQFWQMSTQNRRIFKVRDFQFWQRCQKRFDDFTYPIVGGGDVFWTPEIYSVNKPGTKVNMFYLTDF